MINKVAYSLDSTVTLYFHHSGLYLWLRFGLFWLKIPQMLIHFELKGVMILLQISLNINQLDVDTVLIIAFVSLIHASQHIWSNMSSIFCKCSCWENPSSFLSFHSTCIAPLVLSASGVRVCVCVCVCVWILSATSSEAAEYIICHV